MNRQIEKETNAVYFPCGLPVAALHFNKLFHRPSFKAPYYDLSLKTPPTLQFNDNYNSALQVQPYRIFSLFPSIQAASSDEFNKSIFSLEQSKESGIDRLKTMFTLTEFGHLSPELTIVMNTMGLSLFVGATIGGTIASRTVVENLVRQYQASVFNHQFEAKRFIQDRITLTLAGNAFKWAWRLALFSGTYTMIVVSTTVYKNKCTILDNVIAGALCGSMWKLKMGLHATAVGGGLGGILGLFAGCLCACVLWLSNTSVEELRFWHHDYWEREYRKKVKEMKQKEGNELELLAMKHDESLEQEQKKLSIKNDSS